MKLCRMIEFADVVMPKPFAYCDPMAATTYHLSSVVCTRVYDGIYVFGDLTHLPLVPHICVGELGNHWFW